MSSFQTTLTNRSQALFDTAYDLALAGQHRESDEMLELAHTMRELEYQLCEIASHAPDALAVLLVKEALSSRRRCRPRHVHLAEPGNAGVLCPKRQGHS